MAVTVDTMRSLYRTFAHMLGVQEFFLADTVFLEFFNIWQTDFNLRTRILRGDNQAAPTQTVASTETYALPSDFLGPFIDVFYENQRCIIRTPEEYFLWKYNRLDTDSNASVDSAAIYVTAYEGNLRINPTPTAAGDDIVYFYVRQPATVSAVTGNMAFQQEWKMAFASYISWQLLEKTWRQFPAEAQQIAAHNDARKFEREYLDWCNNAMAKQVRSGRTMRTTPMEM